MALTPTEIAYIRLSVGDGCGVITDAQIQHAYDTAGGEECGTNAIISRWIYMSAKTTLLALANGQQYSSTAVIDVYRQRMLDWQACAGTLGGVIGVGVMNLDLDTVADDLTGV